jgi:[ribosomal protein S18]-alanine N-acetyltransferase
VSAEFIIRKAGIKDIDRIYEIELECFKHPWIIDAFIKELNIPHTDILVAEADKKIIGFSVSWMIIDELHLHKLAVTGSFKRAGIGSALINNLINKHSDALKTVLLEVREKNTVARQFYDSLGFIEKRIRYNYYPDDNAIIIEKDIN